jgi:hypothetical protein
VKLIGIGERLDVRLEDWCVDVVDDDQEKTAKAVSIYISK